MSPCNELFPHAVAEISLTYSVVNGVGEVRCEAIGWPASQDAASHVSLTGPNTQTVIMRMPYEVTIVTTQTINPAPDCLPPQTCIINVFMDELSGTLTPCLTPNPTRECGCVCPLFMLLALTKCSLQMAGI